MIHPKQTQILWLVGLAVFLLALFQMLRGNWAELALIKETRLPGSNSIPDSGTNQKPRYIFVDLGANNADSLAIFLKRENAEFQFDFPHPDWATHNEAEIYLFEANPLFNSVLIGAKEQYGLLGIKVNIFPSTVVDVKDGTRTFFLDTINEKYDFAGSSRYAAHPDVVKSGSNGTELSAINISRWLLMNTLPSDFVVVKMDIEGSEFDIIPHMVEMSLWLVIDYIFIEWHPASFLGGTPEEIAFREKRAEAATEKLKAEGVEILPWQ